MELSFITAALRRRWWLILLFAQLGALPFLFVSAPVSTTYESRALLLVQPADDERSSATQPDRYVKSEIAGLEGRTMAERVTEELGADYDVAEVRQSSTFEHQLETDIVLVTVANDDPDRAQAIAQAYVETYVGDLRAAEDAEIQADLDDIDDQLAAANEQLTEVNDEIQSVMAGYIANVEVTNQIPDLSDVRPELAVQQSQLQTKIRDLEDLRSTVSRTESAINSRVVQNATLPEEPVQQSQSLFLIAFFVAMVLLGISAALIWARFSRKVLDEVAAQDAIGAPVVARLDGDKRLRQRPLEALTQLPQGLVPIVDQLCVRAEALAQIDQPLAVAVVGSHRGAGSTTTAMAMASRFAAAGYEVVLVDADARDTWITDVLSRPDHGGLPALLGDRESERIFSPTPVAGVRALGVGDNAGALRRESVPSVLAASRAVARVVVVDGGPVFDSASTVELVKQVDAVVLAVPLSQQGEAELVAIGHQLRDQRHKLLPVITEPHRKVADREPVIVSAPRSGGGSDGSGGVVSVRDDIDAELAAARSTRVAGRRRGTRAGS